MAVIADESVTRVEHRRLDLSNAQWELLGDLVKILHPLEIGTNHLCSESTSSISSILPVLFGILKHLEVKEGDSQILEDSRCLSTLKLKVGRI